MLQLLHINYAADMEHIISRSLQVVLLKANTSRVPYLTDRHQSRS